MLYVNFVGRATEVDDAACHMWPLTEDRIGRFKKFEVALAPGRELSRQLVDVQSIEGDNVFGPQFFYSSDVCPANMAKVGMHYQSTDFSADANKVLQIPAKAEFAQAKVKYLLPPSFVGEAMYIADRKLIRVFQSLASNVCVYVLTLQFRYLMIYPGFRKRKPSRN